MENTSNQIEVVLSNVRLSARYGFIIYPIDYGILQKVLTLQGYQVAKTPNTPIEGISVEPVGLIAKKGNITVDSLSDKQVIGINANNEQAALSSFEELENGLSTELGIDLTTKKQFYEATMYLAVRTGKNPLTTMSQLRERYPYQKEMSKIFGEDIAPLSYRISPTNRPIDSPDWFEFNIEPLTSRATSFYRVALIYRSSTRSSVMEKVTNSRNMITQTLHMLESSG